MVILRAAIRSMVFASTIVLMSAFCKISCPAFRLMFRPMEVTSAFRVISQTPPDWSRILPAAIMPVSSASPSLIVMPPLLVTSTR